MIDRGPHSLFSDKINRFCLTATPLELCMSFNNCIATELIDSWKSHIPVASG